jgi:hypothetical protein
VKLVAEIGRLAEEAGHHPDVNLRCAGAGGTIVNDGYAPMWWTLTDPEGNEVDLATWVGRD